MDLCIYRTHIQGGIEYVGNTMDTLPEVDIKSYTGELQNHVENKVDAKLGDLQKHILRRYRPINYEFTKNTNMQ